MVYRWAQLGKTTHIELHHFDFIVPRDLARNIPSAITLWVLLRRPPLSVATPPYTKDAPCTCTLNYFGMFIMTLHYGQRLELAPIS